MNAIGPFDEPISKEILKKVSEVIPKIEIGDIRLAEASAVMNGNPAPATAELFAEHQIQSAEVDGDLLVVRVRFGLKIKAPGDNQPELVSFAAIFRLVYSSAQMKELPTESVSQFANTNSVHNAWPYWREFVQNMIARMGLPILTLPLLKLLPPPKVKTKVATDGDTKPA